MPALRKSVPLILVLALLGQGANLRAEVRRSGVAGRVVGEANPLTSAHIYAYQLADLSLRKVMTDGQGNFLFQDLPAGLYKIIAHKSGFMPAVIMLTRTTAQAYQFLEVQLAQRQAGQASGRGRLLGHPRPGAGRRAAPDRNLRGGRTHGPARRARLVRRGLAGLPPQRLQDGCAGADRRRPDRGRGGRADVRRRPRIQGAGRGYQVRPARPLLPGEPKRHLPAQRQRGRRHRPDEQPGDQPGARTEQPGEHPVVQQPDDHPRRVGPRRAGRPGALPGQLDAGRGRERPFGDRRPLHDREQLPPSGRDRSAGHSGDVADLERRGRLHRDVQRPQLAAGGPAVPRAPVRPRRRRRAGQSDQPAAGPLERRPVQPRRRPGPARGAHGVRPVQHALGRQPVA